MKSKRSIKIISVVLILVLICISITYLKNDSKVVLATTKEFNSENLQDNEHMHVEVDSTEDKVPVPNGYVGSKAIGENEIDTGYVIYEGTEEVNDSNVEEAQKTRNQYVWIPVPDASKMYGTDANGKKWGKLYEFTTETGDNVDSITGTKPLTWSWSESNGEIKIDMNRNKEPWIRKDSDKDSRLKTLNLDVETMYDFLVILEQEFNDMIESVKKYGGFYLGRYETGDLNQNDAVVVKGNSKITGRYLKGIKWYSCYQLCKTLKSKNTNIETGMIWGCQWDRILMWLIESGNKTKEEICNSTEWGNTEGNWEALKSTGYSEDWKVANIYDLLGNINEWTMESGSWNNSDRISRGGCYYNNTYTVTRRDSDAPHGADSLGFSAGCRAMLYIK